MFELIVERRIEEAARRGEFRGLPGEGRPLELDDEDPIAPPETRMARRILKNSGYDTPDALEAEERAGRERALRALTLLKEAKDPGATA